MTEFAEESPESLASSYVCAIVQSEVYFAKLCSFVEDSKEDVRLNSTGLPLVLSAHFKTME